MSTLLSFREHLDDERRAALGLSGEAWPRLEALLEGGPGELERLLAHREDLGRPPVAALQAALEGWREYRTWKDAARASRLPASLLCRTRWPHQVALLERSAARLGPQGPHAALLALWTAALALAMDEGEVRAVPAVPLDDPGIAPYLEALGSGAAPAELTAHRWLAWRRAEREGLVQIRLILPREAIVAQVALRPEILNESELIAELVLDPLPAVLRALLDRRAEDEAIRAAALAYQGLLDAPAIRAGRLAALYVGAPRQALGAVLVDGAGRVLAQRRFPPRPGWQQELSGWLAQQRPEHCLLPTGAPDHARLEATRRLLPVACSAMVTAGLPEARRALPGPERSLPAELASALVLARRGLDPWTAWSSIDPVALGLAEYGQDLDEERLRARLQDTLAVARERRRAGGSAATPAPAPAAAPPLPHHLNPLVRSLADLRPGMMVSAVVTSLAPFGAFVTIGLEEEGLIHVSELADRFVKDPAEVVRLGQELRCRVLEVDPARRRIGLSLRAAPEDGGHRPRPAEARGNGKALAELEKLFRR